MPEIGLHNSRLDNLAVKCYHLVDVKGEVVNQTSDSFYDLVEKRLSYYGLHISFSVKNSIFCGGSVNLKVITSSGIVFLNASGDFVTEPCNMKASRYIQGCWEQYVMDSEPLGGQA